MQARVQGPDTHPREMWGKRTIFPIPRLPPVISTVFPLTPKRECKPRELMMMMVAVTDKSAGTATARCVGRSWYRFEISRSAPPDAIMWL